MKGMLALAVVLTAAVAACAEDEATGLPDVEKPALASGNPGPWSSVRSFAIK